jgi:hypothetical protein
MRQTRPRGQRKWMPLVLMSLIASGALFLSVFYPLQFVTSFGDKAVYEIGYNLPDGNIASLLGKRVVLKGE